MAASISETKAAINAALHGSGYSCKVVSWDDASRGTVGGGLSCWGSNITDTYLKARDGTQLFTVRPDNFNEKLGCLSADELAVVCNPVGGPDEGADLAPTTIRDFLSNISKHGGYAGLNTSLFDENLDQQISIRFQTTFLPVEGARGTLEFATEAYNYNTHSDDDPKNLVLLCTTQGVAVQQDGRGAQRLFHHVAKPSGTISRHWLEAERSTHAVGSAQKETAEERADALKRGKAVSSVIGCRALGTRFNVLLTVQVPLKQKPPSAPRGGFGFAGGGGGSVSLDAVMASSNSLSFQSKTFYKSSKKSGGIFSGLSSALFGGGSAMMSSTSAGGGPDFGGYEEECDGESDDDFLGDLEQSVGRLNEVAGAINAEIDEQGVPTPPPMPFAAAACSGPQLRFRCAARAPQRRKKGVANAARVSRGSRHDTWGGLGVNDPERHPSEHLTCTVVIYNTVEGGVPTEEDVLAAVEDLERLYAACNPGRLGSAKFDFMKKELTVHDAQTIAAKLATQPRPSDVLGHDVFPSSRTVPVVPAAIDACPA